jgi:hypothetical protein
MVTNCGTDRGHHEFQASQDKLLRNLIFEHEKKLGTEARQKAMELRDLLRIS